MENSTVDAAAFLAAGRMGFELVPADRSLAVASIPVP